jgi:hypothetical protein
MTQDKIDRDNIAGRVQGTVHDAVTDTMGAASGGRKHSTMVGSDKARLLLEKQA